MSLGLVTKVMLPGAKVLVSSVDLVTHCQLPLGQVKPGDVSIGITSELSESPVRQPSPTPTGYRQPPRSCYHRVDKNYNILVHLERLDVPPRAHDMGSLPQPMGLSKGQMELGVKATSEVTTCCLIGLSSTVRPVDVQDSEESGSEKW